MKGAEFWQVHDVVLKMILTGMLIYVPPAFRASVATMLTVISIANLNFFIPHKNRTLFWLTQVSFIVTCFKYLTALMIGAAKEDQKGNVLFGIMLISLDIVFMVTAIFACGATFVMILDKIKKMKSVKHRMRSSISRHTAKLKSKEWLDSLKVNRVDETNGPPPPPGVQASKTKVQPTTEEDAGLWT